MSKSSSAYTKARANANQFINDVRIGKNVKISPFVNLYECELDDDVFIGPFVEIQAGVKVGAGSRIQSHSFICSHVTIGKNVFVGHGVKFINDKYPRMAREWKPLKTTVEDNASIGTNATIMPVRIGSWAMVGAGAVVTKDVHNGSTVVGNPAKIIDSGI